MMLWTGLMTLLSRLTSCHFLQQQLLQMALRQM